MYVTEFSETRIGNRVYIFREEREGRTETWGVQAKQDVTDPSPWTKFEIVEYFQFPHDEYTQAQAVYLALVRVALHHERSGKTTNR